jgi:hypothetical protein
MLSSVARLRTPASRLASRNLSAAAGGKIHELRQYVLKTECLPDYLKLTGSDAFKPRTDASPLLGFFLVETGGQLNRVVHLWEYDCLDHRTEVRKQLAGDAGFVDYFTKIRPWLATQESVLLRPTHFDATNKAGANNGAFFALQNGIDEEWVDEDGVVQEPAEDDVALVGSWEEVVGENGMEWQLYSAPTYQSLLESERVTAVGTSTTLMAPTPFSPMQ